MLRVEVSGGKEIRAGLTSMQLRSRNLKAPLDKGADFIFTNIAKNFRVRSGWAPLTAKTLAVKRYLGYGDKPSLVRTETLIRSATKKDALFQDYDLRPDSLTIRVLLRYAGLQNFGGGYIPGRRFWFIGKDVAMKLVKEIQRHIFKRRTGRGK